MPINVNLSPDRGVDSQMLINRDEESILSDIAEEAFGFRRINSETLYHAEDSSLKFNASDTLQDVFFKLVNAGETKIPSRRNDIKNIKVFIKFRDPTIQDSSSTGSDLSLLSESGNSGTSTSDSGESSEEETGQKKRNKRKSIKKRSSTKRTSTKRRKTKRRKTTKKKTRRNTKKRKVVKRTRRR